MRRDCNKIILIAKKVAKSPLGFSDICEQRCDSKGRV